MWKEVDTNPMGRATNIEEVCLVIVHLTSQHSNKIISQIINVDGGKSLTIKGLHTWYEVKNDINRSFEVVESASIIDFFKQKLRPNISVTNVL